MVTPFGSMSHCAAGQIPFGVFLIYGFVESLPREPDESAIIDGCGPFTLFFRVLFPLLTPVLVATGILNFIGTWNDFINPTSRCLLCISWDSAISSPG